MRRDNNMPYENIWKFIVSENTTFLYFILPEIRQSIRCVLMHNLLPFSPLCSSYVSDIPLCPAHGWATDSGRWSLLFYLRKSQDPLVKHFANLLSLQVGAMLVLISFTKWKFTALVTVGFPLTLKWHSAMTCLITVQWGFELNPFTHIVSVKRIARIRRGLGLNPRVISGIGD